MKTIVIGWNPQAERDITNEANAVSLAFRGLVSAYQEQGVPFSLDVEKALSDVSSEVVLGGSREVSQDKKLELLGINATLLTESSSRPRQSVFGVRHPSRPTHRIRRSTKQDSNCQNQSRMRNPRKWREGN
jgi:hypothetical protein